MFANVLLFTVRQGLVKGFKVKKKYITQYVRGTSNESI